LIFSGTCYSPKRCVLSETKSQIKMSINLCQQFLERDSIEIVKTEMLEKERKRGRFLDEVKQEGIEREEKRLKEEKHLKELHQKKIFDCITNKNNWSYDAKNDEYSLQSISQINCLKDRELHGVFKEYLNKEMISYRKVLLENCDCEITCSCKKI
jgi:hypothetical protein